MSSRVLVDDPIPGTATRQDRFPAVDSLRAVGALAVVLTHVAFQTGQYPRGLVGALFSRLDVGVALFFVVSGFLLSIGFLRPLVEGRPTPGLGAYALKRVLRIWPVFVVTLVVVHLTIARDPGLGSWVRSLTMTTLYTPDYFTDGLTQMWSLETEVAFYVVLPLLLLPVARLARRRVLRGTLALSAALVVVTIVWVAVASGRVDDHRPFAHLWLLSYLDWFAAGIALAVAWVARSRGARHRALDLLDLAGSLPGVCWTLAFSCLLVASTPLAGPLDLTPSTSATTAVVKNLLYLAVGVLLVVPAVFGPETPYRRVLEHRVLRYLGQISYSVFCIHLVLLHAALSLTSTEIFTGRFWLVAPVTLALTLVAAIALHHLVERPAIRLAARLTRPRSAA
ncbi:hypothetical protein ASD11_05645 [Aeromicrobium sp. Root495]|uniref:acyltransferase family protein n=1 Tax=Aeromicrobium sp. Root495 TaxID=1736550 RepID=UPI0006FDCF25|nr:acyltransferase [Aeromicrobium sp. Root495]KQY59085.1 hypothetical protein ASD11_05645 [Aeromicrobium sp. Root495]